MSLGPSLAMGNLRLFFPALMPNALHFFLRNRAQVKCVGLLPFQMAFPSMAYILGGYNNLLPN